MHIRIIRNFDNPDTEDIDLEVCLEDFPFDPDDEQQLMALEAVILIHLEKLEDE